MIKREGLERTSIEGGMGQKARDREDYYLEDVGQFLTSVQPSRRAYF